MHPSPRVFPLALGLLLLGLGLPAPYAVAQPSPELQELQETLHELKAGQQAIQKDLQELKAIFMRAARQAAQQAGQQAAQPPQEVVLRVDHEPFKGELNARLTLIEFTDYQ